MSDWGVALIAAGSAIAGSVVTGWYGRSAGLRQAEAARHSGDRQADALLTSVRMTLGADEQRAAREARRGTYAEFLGAAESGIVAARTGLGTAEDEPRLYRALSALTLEAPPTVADAAHHVVDALRRHDTQDDLRHAKESFVAAAREDLNRADG
ncbi:hypothetical protein [Streptomyces endophyticus]|uniref:Protein kilB n=1 Tax=Streptomyces endophyticus TaxID=714166 RepID=A0ABU6EWG3_9ACTN|nr:hypothetical protein [Streptomyces endophyticus]MEB8335929.1 hypothetical protein [Streptomyces endophyticus]